MHTGVITVTGILTLARMHPKTILMELHIEKNRIGLHFPLKVQCIKFCGI